MGDTIEHALAVDGYAVFDAMDADAIARLRVVHDDLGLPDDVRFFATHAALTGTARRSVSDAVHREVAPAVDREFGPRQVFAGAILSKGGTAPEVAFHQDLTFTDEREHRSFTCWVALTETDVDAGAITVIPGSHRWTDGIRPGGPNEMPTAAWQDALASRARTIPLTPGQAVVWDAALVHGSHPNRSGYPRPAATVAFTASAADLSYFHRGGDGLVEGFAIDEEHFFTRRPFLDRPTQEATIAPWADPVGEEDFAPHLRAAERA